KQVSIGSISSVGQISGNIFNSLTTFNQLQVSISSVNSIFEKFGAFEKSSHYRYIDKDIEEIKLTNVGYSFKDKEVFKNINCSFEKGKNYAIVGESGSGKSTLINIILGNNKQYSGSVKYNDVEISDIEESQLFKSVSYIGNITHIYH
ncbi:ATP-binding cassette domain-containing protein, partial [Streptococcus thermophilus]|nr:ATP-binding cassette domain-containing protein [Streptococcus thermophilus]